MFFERQPCLLVYVGITILGLCMSLSPFRLSLPSIEIQAAFFFQSSLFSAFPQPRLCSQNEVEQNIVTMIERV
jgi:hypothetical protein